MEKTKKIGFFKRLKMAIFELENYIDFTSEKMSKSIGFMIKCIILCAIILIGIIFGIIYGKYGTPAKYVDSIVPQFSYENNVITIDKEDAKKDEKKTMATVLKQVEPTLKIILNDSSYNKDKLISDINNNERELVVIGVLAFFIEAIMDLLVFWLMTAVMTSFVGWIFLNFSRVKMKYSKLFALSIYASTLTVLISAGYTLLNAFFGIYIEVFDYLAMLIAYIYITAVIYMIRSDLIKQQVELIRIATIQAKVKEQLKNEDEEKKKEENNESDEKQPEPSDNPNDKKDDEGKDEELDDEPDGSEI